MITIRPAVLADCEQLLVITQKAFIVNHQFDADFKDSFLHPASAQAFFEEEITSPDWCFLVAEENGTILGYVSGTEVKIPYRMSRYFEIETMGVDPATQGKGIGSQLIDAVAKAVKERGFTKLYVNAYARNEVALSFYQKNGFEIIDISLEKSI